MVRDTAALYLEAMLDAEVLLARHAQPLLHPGQSVVTLSHSESVMGILRHAANRGTRLHVAVTPSHPADEGFESAREIASMGHRVTLAPDIALGTLIARCDVVLLGANSVSEEVVVNRTGTHTVATIAWHHERPVYVAAELCKLVPHAMHVHPSHISPWPLDAQNLPPEIEILSPLDEELPLWSFAGVITEEGVLTPRQVGERIASLNIDHTLALTLFM